MFFSMGCANLAGEGSPRGWQPNAVSPRPSPRWNIHGAPPDVMNASPRDVPTMLVPDIPPRSKELMNSPRGIVQPAWSAQMSPRPLPGSALRSPRNDFRDVRAGATSGCLPTHNITMSYECQGLPFTDLFSSQACLGLLTVRKTSYCSVPGLDSPNVAIDSLRSPMQLYTLI